jgi:hypothetical protein
VTFGCGFVLIGFLVIFTINRVVDIYSSHLPQPIWSVLDSPVFGLWMQN